MSQTIDNIGLENVEWSFAIEKSLDKRIVEGVVIPAKTIDAHGDTIKPHVIDETAAKFLNKFNTKTKLGVQHSTFNKNFQLRQSYVTKSDISLGKKKIGKGSWVIQVKVLDDETWKKIKNNKITGFSIGGWAKAKQISKDVRELVEIEVNEISLVDEPANLISFNVIKSKNITEEQMSDAKQETKTEEVVEKNVDNKTETVAKETNDSNGVDILKAMESVAKSVDDIAKSLDKKEAVIEDNVSVEKKEGKEVVKDVVEKKEETEPVAKSEEIKEPQDTLGVLKDAIAKAEAMTPDVVEDINKAVKSLQSVVDGLSDETKVTEKKVEKSEDGPLTPKLEELTTKLTKQLDEISSRVEKLESTKNPPKSVVDNKTDAGEKVEKSLWSGVLFR